MKIIYTQTDEAPALATHSLLPVIEAFAQAAGVEVETRDISLAARVLAAFGKEPDALAELGDLAKTPEANIIKLPNISASQPQLEACIAELREQGHDLPDYADAKEQYDRVKGSAVNPVLREGNSDRRAPASVKSFARSHPHRMGAWSSDSKTHVATMGHDDFRSTEVSTTIAAPTTARIEHVAADGTTTVLRDGLELQEGEVLDASLMRATALRDFLAEQVADAKEQGVLLSVHLKATMMKVSDPILFGFAVRAVVGDLFDDVPDVSANDGLGTLLARHPEKQEAVDAALAAGPALYMVDSDRGVTNLHVPSDVIIDASMPALIRASGQGWDAAGEQQDTKCVIPDSSYAPLYDEAIEHCKQHGAFDPATMGSVPNVGLMAQKAEEYGSHDKTFQASAPGTIRIVDAEGTELLSHEVAEGDVWRACQTKDAPIQDWVRLAVDRARATGSPAVFWLDETRAHDAQLLEKVRPALEALDTDGLDIRVLPVAEAARLSLERARDGQDTISVTGNVLRDYLTDLFPILELGTSAKMLSIVPLMAGGGLFETGAGGSAPKHVQQFVKEDHLRWDSLGEFLALAVSFEFLADKTDNPRARLLGQTLDRATGTLLEHGQSPSRKVGELDNRGSHAHLATYWARELASQTEDAELAAAFGPVADSLEGSIDTIIAELAEVEGEPVDLGGYFRFDGEKADAAMRPSATLNQALSAIAQAAA